MIIKGEYKNNPALKGNNFTKGEYKINDELEIYDFCTCNSRYVRVKIIDIVDKGQYNMYICKNLVSGCRVSFTDRELNENLRKLRIVRG